MPLSSPPTRAFALRAGSEAAKLFGDRIFTLLLATQIVLLALALVFTPQAIDLLAPGFSREPQQFALAVSAHAHHLSPIFCSSPW